MKLFVSLRCHMNMASRLRMLRLIPIALSVRTPRPTLSTVTPRTQMLRHFHSALRTKGQMSNKILFHIGGDLLNPDGVILFKSASFSVLSDIHYEDMIDCSDLETKTICSRDMQVIYDFISEEEERQVVSEVEPYLSRLQYESSHWDDAIHGYRETERKVWSEKNKRIIQRVRDTAFPPGTAQLSYVHVLDLKKEGFIKPHVDAVKFCGNTIAGISLLSPAIMRLVHTEDKTKYADVLLERRSLYIMKDSARYNYTHEILPDGSTFKDKPVTKDRRISVICRNEP